MMITVFLYIYKPVASKTLNPTNREMHKSFGSKMYIYEQSVTEIYFLFEFSWEIEARNDPSCSATEKKKIK